MRSLLVALGTLAAIPVGLTLLGWAWNRWDGPPRWSEDEHWKIAKEIMP